MTRKLLYDKRFSVKKYSFTHFRKKPLSYCVTKENRNKVYLLRFKATKEVELTILQHKIIQNVLAKNSILYKIKKKVASPSCVSNSRNMHHLFISCPHASFLGAQVPKLVFYRK